MTTMNNSVRRMNHRLQPDLEACSAKPRTTTPPKAPSDNAQPLTVGTPFSGPGSTRATWFAG